MIGSLDTVSRNTIREAFDSEKPSVFRGLLFVVSSIGIEHHFIDFVSRRHRIRFSTAVAPLAEIEF